MATLAPLPGCWIGSWRGIPFHIPDVTSPAGRRLVAIHLPGTDVTIHEDLGRANRPIRVNGLVAGEDYIAQAAALQASFDTPGPGTLVHPWLGPVTAILSDEGADITFRSAELLTASFTASFQRWTPVGVPVSTLSLVFTAATALAGLALALFEAADRRLTIDLGTSVAAGATVAVAALASRSGGQPLAALAAGPVVGGLSAVAAAERVSSPAEADAWAASLVGALAGAGTPPKRAAIGIGPTGRASEASVDPWATTRGLLDIATAAAAMTPEEDGQDLIGAGLAVAAVAALAEPLAAVSWESRQQAEAARVTISAAIGEVAAALVVMDGGDAAGLSAIRAAWRALADLRRRVHEDLDDRIGRLPSVLTLTPPTRVSAWTVAHYVAGDDPKAVRAAFEDIVKRNGIIHPARLEPGAAIEVLPTTRASR